LQHKNLITNIIILTENKFKNIQQKSLYHVVILNKKLTCISIKTKANFTGTTTPVLMTFFSRTIQVSRYQKGKTSLDLNEEETMGYWDTAAMAGLSAKKHLKSDSYTLLRTDNHTYTPITQFLQA